MVVIEYNKHGEYRLNVDENNGEWTPVKNIARNQGYLAFSYHWGVGLQHMYVYQGQLHAVDKIRGQR